MKIISTIWQAWKRIGQTIGDFIGRIVLMVFYFTIFMPFGLGVRLLGDPLSIKPKYQVGWLARTTYDREITDARRLS